MLAYFVEVKWLFDVVFGAWRKRGHLVASLALLEAWASQVIFPLEVTDLKSFGIDVEDVILALDRDVAIVASVFLDLHWLAELVHRRGKLRLLEVFINQFLLPHEVGDELATDQVLGLFVLAWDCRVNNFVSVEHGASWDWLPSETLNYFWLLNHIACNINGSRRVLVVPAENFEHTIHHVFVLLCYHTLLNFLTLGLQWFRLLWHVWQDASCWLVLARPDDCAVIESLAFALFLVILFRPLEANFLDAISLQTFYAALILNCLTRRLPRFRMANRSTFVLIITGPWLD